MNKKMIIDATHSEETRVVLLDNNNAVEDFDFESVAHQQVKGNIYLAKVTRVEPSLQAAFVEYNGEKHGFLPFSQIHPNYFKIPMEDRFEEIIEDDDNNEDVFDDAIDLTDEKISDGVSIEEDASFEIEIDEDGDAGSLVDMTYMDDQNSGDDVSTDEKQDTENNLVKNRRSRRRVRFHDKYRIQEVVKKNQIILVQVVKEERGNKGAALTSYISIPGRYCVLMPNTEGAGGISRKISDIKDRKKLKAVLDDLETPDNMSIIVRTAGRGRTKSEIKRDFQYLMKLWNEICEKTVESSAPTLIYEEADLVKRAIRDLYDRDVEEVLVEGEEGYKAAKDFMKALVPSHAKRVKLYKDSTKLFHTFHIEEQLEAVHHPEVRLPSGGYLVINQTEALVAIDVNSGQSTRERNVELMAYNTNLEAAQEIARQMRLRDIGGLVVVDFIDMEERKHNQAVERKMRQAIRSDRARIQLSNISFLGLMELSRQRLKPSLAERYLKACPHCEGTGHIRSVESISLSILRKIEDILVRGKNVTDIRLHVDLQHAEYLFNHKSAVLSEIEDRYGISIYIQIDQRINEPVFDIHIQQKQYPKSVTLSESIEDLNADGRSGKNNRRTRRDQAKPKGHKKHEEISSKTSDGAKSSDVPAKSRRSSRRMKQNEMAAKMQEDLEAPEGLQETSSKMPSEDSSGKKSSSKGKKANKAVAKRKTIAEEMRDPIEAPDNTLKSVKKKPARRTRQSKEKTSVKVVRANETDNTVEKITPNNTLGKTSAKKAVQKGKKAQAAKSSVKQLSKEDVTADAKPDNVLSVALKAAPTASDENTVQETASVSSTSDNENKKPDSWWKKIIS